MNGYSSLSLTPIKTWYGLYKWGNKNNCTESCVHVCFYLCCFFVFLYQLPSLQSDLEDKREVSNGEGSMMAQQSQCGFFETSAKERVNIDECFHELVRRIKKFQIQGASDKKQTKKGGKCILMWCQINELSIYRARSFPLVFFFIESFCVRVCVFTSSVLLNGRMHPFLFCV